MKPVLTAEQLPFAFVADEALARCFEILHGDGAASGKCGRLWDSLRSRPYELLPWCHAACIPGERCLVEWAALSREEKTALLVALQDMVNFFQQVGAGA